VVVYERVSAGVGFSARLYDLHDELLQAALEMVSDCRCRSGCPACVGPPGDIGPDTKAVTRQLLGLLVGKEGSPPVVVREDKDWPGYSF